jgi:hypothetical protein
MKYLLPTCLSLAAIAALPSSASAQEAQTVNFHFKQVKKWETQLPNENWNTIGAYLEIANGDEKGFVVDNGPFKLVIDSDGNGKPDEVIKGLGGEALLKGKHKDGSKFEYAVRVRKDREQWQFACGGVMTGKINGIPVSLIDQNNNGIWNEVGTDAMIVGKSSAASYLSKIINVKGELLEFSASEDGSSITLKPYQGESGILNAVEKYNSKGKLTSAVFSSRDREVSFELSQSKKGLRVPINEYELSSATAAKSVEHVRIRRGSMRGITVKGGDEQIIQWGGPLRIEFTHHRTDDESITVNLPTFYGDAEEEYYDFFPGGKSPSILVTDKKTGKEVWSGKFCES